MSHGRHNFGFSSGRWRLTVCMPTVNTTSAMSAKVHTLVNPTHTRAIVVNCRWRQLANSCTVTLCQAGRPRFNHSHQLRCWPKVGPMGRLFGRPGQAAWLGLSRLGKVVRSYRGSQVSAMRLSTTTGVSRHAMPGHGSWAVANGFGCPEPMLGL